MERLPLDARRRMWLIACLVLGSSAYFYEAGGWNQNTRLDLVRAIVERHTLRIDAFHENTGDKAVFEGHVFADKAPGASLVAVPGAAVVRAAVGSARLEANDKAAVTWVSYASTLMASALPAALAAAGVFWLALLLGADQKAGGVAAVTCGLATPMWAYATVMYGHALAAACLVGSYAAGCRLSPAVPSTRTRDARLGFSLGVLAGWSVVTEYPSAIPAAIVLVFAVWQARSADRARLIRLAVATAAGLGLAAAVLAGYSWLAFGSPFHIGYSSEPGYEGMRTGVFGIGWPKLHVAREILIGSYRGLLPLAPVLLVAPIGLAMWLRDRRTAAAAITAAAIVLYYFVMVSGYAYWEGGWSYGSRHLAPALPFLALAIAPVWQRGRAFARLLILALLVASAAQGLMAVSTTPQLPGGMEHPMRDLVWPAFRTGEFGLNWQSVLEMGPPPGAPSQLEARGILRQGWNIGQKIGFRGHASLIPLLLFWTGCAVVWAGLADRRAGSRR